MKYLFVNQNNCNGGSGGGSNSNNNSSNGFVTVNVNPWVNMYFPWYHPPAPSTPEPQPNDRDGLDCKTCLDFYQYVIPNQEDGTFICFKCRNGY